MVEASRPATLRPNEFGGSKEPSIDLSTSNSRPGLLDDLLTETLMKSVWRVGVMCKEILDGKCFSCSPAPFLDISLSFTSFITSNLYMHKISC